MKNFDEQEFVRDFSLLPLNIIYSTDDPDEQLEYFNGLFTECLQNHAPLRQVKVTRPPAHWMNDEKIRSLQKRRDVVRKEAHQTRSDETWSKFREIRNEMKASIRRARESLMKQALSSMMTQHLI